MTVSLPTRPQHLDQVTTVGFPHRPSPLRPASLHLFGGFGLTGGFTLRLCQDHSTFDTDGEAITVCELPQDHYVAEGETGARIACGVVMERN